MEKITGNEQAYPSQKQILGSGEDYHEIPGQPGLTKREYFAAMAMQGLLANPDEGKRQYLESKVPELANCKTPAEFLCKTSALMADALITALNK